MISEDVERGIRLAVYIGIILACFKYLVGH